MNLVDDLVEPFRPIADFVIWQRIQEYSKELTSEGKLRLASFVYATSANGRRILTPVASSRKVLPFILPDTVWGTAADGAAPSLPTTLDSI